MTGNSISNLPRARGQALESTDSSTVTERWAEDTAKWGWERRWGKARRGPAGRHYISSLEGNISAGRYRTAKLWGEGQEEQGIQAEQLAGAWPKNGWWLRVEPREVCWHWTREEVWGDVEQEGRDAKWCQRAMALVHYRQQSFRC